MTATKYNNKVLRAAAIAGALATVPGVLAQQTEVTPASTSVPAIIDGNTATNPGFVSALVTLDPTSADGFREFCTGSLIAPGYVLTAAHCVYDACAAATANYDPTTQQCTVADNWSTTQVRVGGNDLRVESQFHLSGVAGVYVHAAYMAGGGTCPPKSNGLCDPTYAYDVAVIKLADPVPASGAGSFEPVKYSCQASAPPVGITTFKYGWGECRGPHCTPPCVPPPDGTCNTPGGVISSQYTLQWTGPTGVPVSKCQSSATSPIPDAVFCTFSDKGAGGGDSGGPNVVLVRGEPLLVGITSFGGGPASDNDLPNGVKFQDGNVRTGAVCQFISDAMAGNPPAADCGDFNVRCGKQYDTSACSNLAFGETCSVTCKYSGAVSTFTCTSAFRPPYWTYKGTLPQCYPGCTTPYGFLRAGTGQWVPANSLLCPPRRGHLCRRMWAYCTKHLQAGTKCYY